MSSGLEFRNGWRRWHFWAAAAFVALALVVTSEVWADIHRLASGDEEASHVYLVPVAVAWLVWVRRSRLRQCAPRGRWVGTAAIAAGWFLWSYGYRNDIQSFWHGGAVLIVVGGLVTALGKDIFSKFLPAFAVLVFLLPVASIVRQQIAIPMQQVTAQLTQGAAELLGFDVLRRGNLLTANGAEIAIVEACNGMRMVFTLFLACYVFAFITPLRGYVRLLVLAASPALAIACNVVRLVPTVWMYGHASRDTATLFHDVSGWVMLMVAFMLLTGITKVLRWAMIPVSPYPLATA